MKYKSLSRFNLAQGYVIDLPDNKIGLIELPLAKLICGDPPEKEILATLTQYLCKEATLEYTGHAIIIVDEDQSVTHPFTLAQVPIAEMDAITVEIPPAKEDLIVAPETPYADDVDKNKDLTVGMLKQMISGLPDDYTVSYDSAYGYVAKGDFTIYHSEKKVSING